MSNASMTREQWVELFQATGLDENMMHKWHCEFERRYPVQHQSFLQWVGLSEKDILSVRTFSQAG
ncbi:MAG: hypothetical protein ACK4L8_03595 [Nitrincola lacisaponensis]|uniref:hypothetical protein n=1 Tax=Nitrincola lacisaponensis TaxID=267850 RepID=UPI0039191B59